MGYPRLCPICLKPMDDWVDENGLSHTRECSGQHPPSIPDEQPGIRRFDTGATRSDDSLRDDPEGFLSPLAIDRYNQYMTKHRVQPDGTVRESDNWQKGMPVTSYAKGMFRHFLHAWTRHRGFTVRDRGAADNLEEDLCAIIFNAQAWLHELMKERHESG